MKKTKEIDQTMGRLYCPIRNKWVTDLPEERFRHGLLNRMVDELGYPKAHIVVEKEVIQLPHLAPEEKLKAPDRRVDIMVYAKNSEGGLFPLLTVECKAVKLTSKVLSQVVGYNHFIRSSFIAVANEEEFRLAWFDRAAGQYSFADYLPSYEQLRSSVKI